MNAYLGMAEMSDPENNPCPGMYPLNVSSWSSVSGSKTGTEFVASRAGWSSDTAATPVRPHVTVDDMSKTVSDL